MRRRDFLRVSCMSAGGFVLSYSVPSLSTTSSPAKSAKNVGPLIEIGEDNSVTIYVFKQEMGQGTTTGVAMIAAEELDADWSTVNIKRMSFQSSIDGYENDWGRFDTGGSYAIESEWALMKTAGATARMMLLATAARKWSVPIAQCHTSSGVVTHTLSGKTFTYGELATEASQLAIPEQTQFKSVDDYRIIGQEHKALKNHDVINGSLTYGIDVRVDGMVHATIVRPPVTGGKLTRFDPKLALEVDGVLDIFPLAPVVRAQLFDKGVRGGVVIVAESTWACIKARRLLRVVWDDGANGDRQAEDLFTVFDSIQHVPDNVRQTGGNQLDGFKSSVLTVEGEYTNPFIAHGLMEPLNAIADLSDGKHLQIWAGTQSPQHSAKHLSEVLGIEKKNITVNPYPMGGGYGRRFFCDYLLEASFISKTVKKPVKLTWSREDEIQFGAYHPLRKDYYKAGLDAQGNIETLSLSSMTGSDWGGSEMSYLYGFKHLHVNSHYHKDSIVTCGSWRSVVMHQDTFSREVFMDEIAHTVKQDPIAYRIAQSKRSSPTNYTSSSNQNIVAALPALKGLQVKVLEAVRDLSAWHRKRSKNIGLGVAITAYHDRSFCAQVAEVEATDSGFRLNKVYVVADCGLIINPNLVRAQIEGGILWGLTPVVHGGVDVVNGAVVQSNFHDMPMLKLADIPEIEIELTNFDDRPPAGVGEFAVVPLAPAVSNAIFAQSGERKRQLKML